MKADVRAGTSPFTLPVWHVVALGFVVLLTRLPWLGHGYGLDADAWRAILAGQHLLETGHYVPSRPPGYPLPEYLLALLLALHAGTPWVVGFVSALLSGVAASLMALIVAPFLGARRAMAAAVLLVFTPVVFSASLSAMDYIWGLTFFLAATALILRSRWHWAALFLGLAAASRPTYALAFLPLAWAGLKSEGLSLREAAAWRKLVPLGLLSGGVTLAFFVPVIVEIGWRVVTPPSPSSGTQTLLWLASSASVQLFGLIGSVFVALTAMAAIFAATKRQPHVEPWPLDGWAWILIGLYAVEFLLLPDEPAYLMPALLGLYVLLARYSPTRMFFVLALAMVASSFVLSLARGKDGKLSLISEGPVLREAALERNRECLRGLVRDHLVHAPQNERVVAAKFRPEIMLLVGPQLADHVLYTVSQRSDGQWEDQEIGLLPPGLHFTVVDRALVQQEKQSSFSVMDTASLCP